MIFQLFIIYANATFLARNLIAQIRTLTLLMILLYQAYYTVKSVDMLKRELLSVMNSLRQLQGDRETNREVINVLW